MLKNKLTVISLFSGAGGMDLGFKQAGFKIIWSNDFFKEACETYKNNVDSNIVFGDITKISSNDIPNNPDVVIGGFPCQGFSIANKNRNETDKRNFLYKELLRVVKDKKPKIFLGENVKGILSMANGKVFQMIQNDFRKIGYTVEYKVFDASEFGVPQKRERVIIYGTRINKSLILSPVPEKGKTVEESIGFLANVPLSQNSFSVNGRIIHNHIASTNVETEFRGRKYKINQHELCDYLNEWRKKKNLSSQKIDDIFGYKYTAGHWFRKDNNCGSIPKPKDWKKLKKILGFDDKYDKQITEFETKQIKFEQSLRITNWNRPSDTITATGPEIHINKKRRLSARECAILQSFPDDFVFCGNLNLIYRQIGNAVPPKLAYKIAVEIKKYLLSNIK